MIIEEENRADAEMFDDSLAIDFNVERFEQKIKSSRPQTRQREHSSSSEDNQNQVQYQQRHQQSYDDQMQTMTLKMKRDHQRSLLIGNNSKFKDESTTSNNSMNHINHINNLQQQISNSRKLKPLEDDTPQLVKLKKLVKINRDLTVQLEKEKSSRQKLEKQVKEYKLQLERDQKNLEQQIQPTQQQQQQQQLSGFMMNETQISGITRQTDLSMISRQSDINKVNDKKLQEYRYKVQTMKNDLNKCLRIIRNEVGEQYGDIQGVNQLIEGEWKGRAQQIEILRNKVQKLQQQLGSTTGNTSCNLSINHYNRDQEKNKQATKQENKQLIEQLNEMADRCQQLEEKNKGLKSRMTILEKTNKDKQCQWDNEKQVLLEKSANDDRYIMLLKNELEKQKQLAQKQASGVVGQTKIIYKNIETQNIGNNQDQVKIQELQQKVFELTEKLKTQKQQNMQNNQQEVQAKQQQKEEKKIRLMEQQIQKLEKENSQLAEKVYGTADKETLCTVRELSQMNAKLRMKIDSLQDQISKQ